jgi:predicted MFS family arabinose efflux permease
MHIGLLAASASGVLYLLSMAWPGSPACALALLLLGRALLGGAESFVVTGTLAWALALAAPHESGRAMAWIGIAMYASFAIGAPIGSALHAAQGFASIGLAGIVLPWLVLPLLRCLPAQPVHAHPTQGGWGVTMRSVWMPGLALALSSFGFAATTTFITLLFVERGWTLPWIGFSAFATAFVAARIVGGRLPYRLGARRMALGSVLLEATGLALVALAVGPGLAITGALLAGLGYSLVFPSFGLEVVRRAPPQHRALAMGGYTACLDLDTASLTRLPS